jgi:seryl-tRNA synthetase
MLDILLLRKDLGTTVERLQTRKNPQPFLNVLEAERKTLQTRTEELQAQRNQLSKQIGMLKGKGEDASAVMAQVAGLGDELKRSAARLDQIQAELANLAAGRAQPAARERAGGRRRAGNVEVRRWGTPRAFDFAPSRTTSTSAPRWGWTSKPASSSRLALHRDEGPDRAPAPRARQFMLDLQTASTATPSATRPTSSTAEHARGHRPAAQVRGRPVLEGLRGEPVPDSSPLYLIPPAKCR